MVKFYAVEPQKKLETFFAQFRLVNYRAYETIFTSSDSPPGVIYLHEGFIRQYAVSEDGTELTIHIYKKGNHFPMTWALAGIPNRYYFQALTDTKVFIAQKDKVLDFLMSDPQIFSEFSKRLLFGLDGLAKRIENLCFGKASDRVISSLIYLAGHFGEKSGDNLVLNYKFTHNDIASIAGITREHVSLEIEKLVKKGILKYEGHAIAFPDFNKLLELSK